MPRKASLANALFRPRSVAMIGASDEGRRHHAMAPLYLEKHGYKGRIIPVNPKRKKVYNHKCYANVYDAPGPIDHALVMTPARTVPAVIQDCAKAGVRVATIFSANFAEAGPDGIRLQDEMMQIAKEGNVRIVGPNCMGVYCMDPPAIISPNRIMQIPKIEKVNPQTHLLSHYWQMSHLKLTSHKNPSNQNHH